MRAFGLTDRGTKRENNEDSLLLNPEINLFIVADGMGGHALGDFASQAAVEILNRFLVQEIAQPKGEKPNSDEEVIMLLEEAVALANQQIYEYSQKLTHQPIIGTTLSLVFFQQEKVFSAHIGDSRIYRLRKGVLEQLTKDHTQAQELVDEEVIQAEGEEYQRLSHLLTRALGSFPQVKADMAVWEWEEGDRFLLSSDGLFRVLNTKRVQEVLADDCTPKEKCRLLVDETLAGGAPDNVSVIIVET